MIYDKKVINQEMSTVVVNSSTNKLNIVPKIIQVVLVK